MRSLLLVLIVGLVLVTGCTKTEKPETRKPVEEPPPGETLAEEKSINKRITELIKQLGDEVWTKREEATAELYNIGEPALEFLEQALKNPDAEIRLRAGILIRKISCLIAYWKFDETSGTIASDSSGNGNHGTVYGAKRVAGKVNGALSFDGVNDYVNVTHSAILDLTGKFSVEAWVNLDSLPIESKLRAIVYKLATPNTNEDNYWLGARQSFFFRIEDAADNYIVVSSTIIETSKWYHVVGVYNGTSLNIYVNGILDGTKFIGAVTPHTGNAPLILGTNAFTTHGAQYKDYFNGLIDEVKIYNRARSAEEIKRDYEKSK